MRCDLLIFAVSLHFLTACGIVGLAQTGAPAVGDTAAGDAAKPDTPQMDACTGVICPGQSACNIGVCDAKAMTCTTTLLADGAPCQEPCMAAGVCQNGVCNGQFVGPKGAACSDGNACTSDDACTMAGCIGKLACDDGDKCTQNACFADSGECYFPPIKDCKP